MEIMSSKKYVPSVFLSNTQGKEGLHQQAYEYTTEHLHPHLNGRKQASVKPHGMSAVRFWKVENRMGLPLASVNTQIKLQNSPLRWLSG